MEKEPKDRCPACDGNGVIGMANPGKQTIWVDCDACNGTGIRGNFGCLTVLLILSVALVCAAIYFWVVPVLL
jgi:hypothetical protein